MRSLLDGHPRLLAWQRVREFAVPPTMIESAATRRSAGDWAGACAVSRVDPELDPRAIGRRHGRELAAEIRADLRHLVPDLLRWHFPRVESGLLRPGLTVSLVRYAPRLHLVARTAPAWADAGQRISLALWDGTSDGRHPHPRPHRRFRLDLHRHLWDARHTTELAVRAGAHSWPPDNAKSGPLDNAKSWLPDGAGCRSLDGAATWPLGGAEKGRGGTAARPSEGVVRPGDDGAGWLSEGVGVSFDEMDGCAVHRWAAEAEILRSAEGREGDPVLVRLSARDHRELPAGLTRDDRGALVKACHGVPWHGPR